MKAEKDKKTGKWLIQYRYTDWQGKRRKSTKRGFATKRGSVPDHTDSGKTGFQRAGTKAVPVHFRDRHDRHGSSVHDLRW